MKPDELVYLAQVIAREVRVRIRDLKLDQEEFRRDFDGVSMTTYMIEKLVGEELSDYGMKLEGLTKCVDEANHAK